MLLRGFCFAAIVTGLLIISASWESEPAPDYSVPLPSLAPPKAMQKSTPESNKNGVVAEPVSSLASAFGVSAPPEKLPVSKPAQTSEPREINPQNTIPLKGTGSTPTDVRTKKSSGKRSAKKRKGL